MATTAGKKKTKRRRVVVRGIEHGISGYTNYGCRCDVCTEANSEHSREYRERRFAGQPLCIIPNCEHIQSRSYGNGLCYKHAQQLQAVRRENPRKARRIEKRLGIGPPKMAAAA